MCTSIHEAKRTEHNHGTECNDTEHRFLERFLRTTSLSASVTQKHDIEHLCGTKACQKNHCERVFGSEAYTNSDASMAQKIARTVILSARRLMHGKMHMLLGRQVATKPCKDPTAYDIPQKVFIDISRFFFARPRGALLNC